MRIVLTTESVYIASRLRDKILRSIKGEEADVKIDTWSYVKAADDYDIIYHNPSQFINDPAKNVIFRVILNGENVIFSCAFWAKNVEPSHEMYCLHVGRLTESLLTYFSKDVSKFSVIEL